MLSAMRSVALLSVGVAASLGAQGPGGDPGPQAAPPRAAAQMLLAHTGPLDLTDAQVVRLAAIARRTEARRRSMRAAMDSARARFMPGTPADSAARRQFRDRMRAHMERAREQGRADQRDAIAVLTPDQQARAWDIVSRRGMGRGMRGQGPRGMRGGGMRRMPRDMQRSPRRRGE